MKVSIILDKRGTLKNGEYPVKIKLLDFDQSIYVAACFVYMRKEYVFRFPIFPYKTLYLPLILFKFCANNMLYGN